MITGSIVVIYYYQNILLVFTGKDLYFIEYLFSLSPLNKVSPLMQGGVISLKNYLSNKSSIKRQIQP